MSDTPRDAWSALRSDPGGCPAGLGLGAKILLLSARVPRGAGGAPGGHDPHSERVASICRAVAGGVSIVCAPVATLTMHRLHDSFRRLLDDHPGVDAVAMPWSLSEIGLDAAGARRALERIASDPASPLLVAAAGHDGATRIRFPASCPSVLAVGVAAEDGRPAGYCGTDLAGHKPELLVPDVTYHARTAGGASRPMRGTSAAVGIVAGLAAAWAAKLRGEGSPADADAVLAALLLWSEAAPGTPRRVTARGLLVPNSACVLRLSQDGPSVPLAPTETRVAAVARGRHLNGPDRAPLSWMPPVPTVSAHGPGTGSETSLPRPRWAVLDVEAGCGDGTVRLTGGGGARSFTLATTSPLGSVGPEARRPGRIRAPRTVLGISASHDASACLMRAGQPEVAVQLERVLRRKHAGTGFLDTTVAADYCLASVGLTPDDVDVFAFNAQPLLPGYVGLSAPCPDAGFTTFDPFDERSLFVSHHLAHAFAAFSSSSFEAAVVVVCDGSGGSVLGGDDLLLTGPELEKYLQLSPGPRLPKVHVFSAYRFDRTGYELVYRETADSFNVRCGSSSIGETYAAVSQYVFGDWLDGSGKLMGLAPYGDPDRCGPTFLEPDDAGLPQFRADWKNDFRNATRRGDPLRCADLAARIQADTETALLHRVRIALAAGGPGSDLVLSGGLALNSVANDRIARESGARRLFVLPASGDAGVALGAAAAAQYRLEGTTSREPTRFSDFLGHPYGKDDCLAALAQFADRVRVSPLDLPEVAATIGGGGVVGWFEGRSEFGPRALGHRSIFADARDRETWDLVNAKVKFREDFRPLAPIVPLEVAGEYFDLEEPSPYMLRVVPVRPERRAGLGAVTHVDGSARVQTVSEEENPRVHRLLWLVAEHTGQPVMINTSLNRRGEPIVETPSQAVELLLGTHLSGLVLGDWFVRPVSPPGLALTLADRVALAPGTRLFSELVGDRPEARIEGRSVEGKGVRVPNWCFDLLCAAAPGRTLGSLLREHCPEDLSADVALGFLSALHSKCLLVVTA